MSLVRKPVVVVTGSSGLIGSALVKRLAGRYVVIGFDRAGPPNPPDAADGIDVDLASDKSVRQALSRARKRHGTDIASVVHLAAYYDFTGEPSPLYNEITVRGTDRLLRGLRNFNVDQFVFSSTMLVHAPCEPGQCIDEDWPINPKWDYPRSKVQTEQLLARVRRMSRVILRIAGVYTDQGCSIPLSHQIQRIYERRMTSLVYPGDLSRGQAYIHLDDLIDAFEAVIDRRAHLPPLTTLLLGEPETLGYGELQEILGRLIHNEDWLTRQISKTLAKAGAWLQDHLPLTEEPFIKPWMIDLADDHYSLDISRAYRLLQWTPKHNLRQTLVKIVQSLKDDPAGWYRVNRLTPPTPADAGDDRQRHEASTLVNVER